MAFDITKEKIKIEKDGRQIECDILFKFDSENTNKSYIGYTDHTTASNGRKNIYVSSINLQKDELELENITDENELNMVYNVLQQLDSEANS